MERFTQLNLQERTENQSTPRKTGSAQPVSFSKQKTAAFLVSIAAGTLLGGFLLETSGCSKGNDKSNRAPISAPSAASVVAAAVPPTAQVPAKPMPKKSRQHRLSASTYSNPACGFSFRYPRGYNLMEGEQAGLERTAMGPAEMNFVRDGGTILTAVALPKGSFPGTDLSAAFFNVSVNSKLTADECRQFLFPQSMSPEQGGSPASTVQPSRVKLGTAGSTEMEDSGGGSAQRMDSKYYHVYRNGTCYEFALEIETASGKITDTPVNRNEVFRKLNAILATVKIEPAAVPEKTVPEVAKGTAGIPAAESKN